MLFWGTVKQDTSFMRWGITIVNRFWHVHTCSCIFDSDHDVSMVPRLSGSPGSSSPSSKPPLSWVQSTPQPLLGDIFRFRIVTWTDESHFLSSQLIMFLLSQIIYHTPTAPKVVYYPQSSETSKPILIKSVLDTYFLPKKMTGFRQHMIGPVVQNWISQGWNQRHNRNMATPRSCSITNVYQGLFMGKRPYSKEEN